MDRITLESARADVLAEDYDRGGQDGDGEKSCAPMDARSASWSTPVNGLTMDELGLLLSHRGAGEREAGWEQGHQAGWERARHGVEQQVQAEVSSWVRAALLMSEGEIAPAAKGAKGVLDALVRARKARGPARVAALAGAEEALTEIVAHLSATAEKHKALAAEISENGVRP